MLQMHEVEDEEEEEEIRSQTIAVIDSLKNQEIRGRAIAEIQSTLDGDHHHLPLLFLLGETNLHSIPYREGFRYFCWRRDRALTSGDARAELLNVEEEDSDEDDDNRHLIVTMMMTLHAAA